MPSGIIGFSVTTIVSPALSGVRWDSTSLGAKDLYALPEKDKIYYCALLHEVWQKGGGGTAVLRGLPEIFPSVCMRKGIV